MMVASPTSRLLLALLSPTIWRTKIRAVPPRLALPDLIESPLGAETSNNSRPRSVFKSKGTLRARKLTLATRCGPAGTAVAGRAKVA